MQRGELLPFKRDFSFAKKTYSFAKEAYSFAKESYASGACLWGGGLPVKFTCRSRGCFSHMFLAYVSRICFSHMFLAYVSRICFSHMLLAYVQQSHATRCTISTQKRYFPTQTTQINTQKRKEASSYCTLVMHCYHTKNNSCTKQTCSHTKETCVHWRIHTQTSTRASLLCVNRSLLYVNRSLLTPYVFFCMDMRDGYVSHNRNVSILTHLFEYGYEKEINTYTKETCAHTKETSVHTKETYPHSNIIKKRDTSHFVCTYWSKETSPPGRVSYLLCSLIKNRM